jgi:hypothetical protein
MFEKNVPIPIGRPTIYPFSGLQIGDSVLYPCELKEKSNARKAAYRTANYHQWKIIVRSLKDGIRVWRLE